MVMAFGVGVLGETLLLMLFNFNLPSADGIYLKC